MFGGTTANDWYTIQNTLNACLNEWRSNNRDAGVQAAISSVNPASITSSNLNHPSIVQTVHLYRPQFTLTDLQQGLAVLDQNTSLVPTVLSGIQSYGMSHYLLSMANEAGNVGAYLASGGISTAAHIGRGVLPARQPQPLPPDPGGPGGYNCATDGALIAMAGTAFLVIGIMTMGAGALAGAAWVGIATWGGLGAGAWTLGHITIGGCGF